MGKEQTTRLNPRTMKSFTKTRRSRRSSSSGGGGEAQTEQQLKAFFKRFDKNGDGRLSKRELKEAFRELGAYLPGWRAWRGICSVDVNGDGLVNLEHELNGLVRYAMQHGYTFNY